MDEIKTIEELKNKIRVAEGLRLDKKYDQAIDLFVKIRKTPLPLYEKLGERQRQWVTAHLGAATMDYFIPQTDREGHLDDAEVLLREALGICCQNGYDPLDGYNFTEIAKVKDSHSPWAWARLGEVFRLKGNLPPFDIHWANSDETGGDDTKFSRPRFRARANDRFYEKGLQCFGIAHTLAKFPEYKEYSWALAHEGATHVNSRRFHPGDSDRVNQAKEALEDALVPHHHRYAWALFYHGGALFLSVMNSIIKSVGEDKDPKAAEIQDEKIQEQADALLMAYSMVAALIDESPSPNKHYMHPGAIGRDEYLTLTYDLLDFLPKLRKMRYSRPFLDVVSQSLTAGVNFLRDDEYMPGSERFRFVYALRYMAYWEEPYVRDGGPKFAAAQVEDAKFEAAFFKDFVKPIVKNDPEVEALYRDLRANRTDFLKQARGFVDGSLLPNPSRPKNFESIPRRVQRNNEHAGSSVILRLFDMMMILLKLGVIDKLIERKTGEKKDTTELEEVVDLFNNKIGRVLTLSPGDAIGCMLKRVSDGHEWLLAPLWALDCSKHAIVAEFLEFEKPKCCAERAE
jgi:hypothetical protein